MTDQIDKLKSNIKELAEKEGKTELEITNELLTGASKMGHEDLVEMLLGIRQPMIQPKLDEIYNR